MRKQVNATEMGQITNQEKRVSQQIKPKNYLQKLDETVNQRRNTLAKLQAIKMIDKQRINDKRSLNNVPKAYEIIIIKQHERQDSPSP